MPFPRPLPALVLALALAACSDSGASCLDDAACGVCSRCERGQCVPVPGCGGTDASSDIADTAEDGGGDDLVGRSTDAELPLDIGSADADAGGAEDALEAEAMTDADADGGPESPLGTAVLVWINGSDDKAYRALVPPDGPPEVDALTDLWSFPADPPCTPVFDKYVSVSPAGGAVLLAGSRVEGCACSQCVAIGDWGPEPPEAVEVVGAVSGPFTKAPPAIAGSHLALLVASATEGPGHVFEALQADDLVPGLYKSSLLYPAATPEPFDHFREPAVDPDLSAILFTCHAGLYWDNTGAGETAICRLALDGESGPPEVVFTDQSAKPEGYGDGRVRHPTWGPVGSILFEAWWLDQPNIWRRDPDGTMSVIGDDVLDVQETSPCRLADGRLASFHRTAETYEVWLRDDLEDSSPTLVTSFANGGDYYLSSALGCGLVEPMK